MFKFRRLIFCAILINIVLIVVLNVFYLSKTELLPDFSVNASKSFIEKLVPAKPKNVLHFEIGRPKPDGKTPSCRFTQSEGLQILAEKYLYPKEKVLENRKCSKTYQTICTLGGSLHSRDSILVNCEQNPCKETVKFGSLNKESGDIQWEDVGSRNLESFIKTVGLKSVEVMYPFFFLKCGENKSSDRTYHFTQILPIPVLISTNNSEQHTSNKETINVNILFLDNLSRRHFYRSLPKTIEAFRMINLNPKSTSNVLDFELYQARRATSRKGKLQFLTGKHNKSGNGNKKSLLDYFKDAGYQTLWQEDVCWKFSQSFFPYLGLGGFTFKDRWKKMKQVMKLNNIDSLGITHSSCLAFKENVIVNMKDYAKKSICVNGKLQHEYFLEFIGKYLTEVDMDTSIKPLFSVTSLNMGDEETGSHVQILDNSLANFVQKMAGDINTITFLISDHGNSYRDFPVQTNEGQYEQYNPFMFMILPRFVERRLGKSIKNLLNNQLRLISVGDVYNTIKYLVGNHQKLNVTKDRGLFKEIDFNRNCEKLGLSSSSLCICDGWNSYETTTAFHYIVAEFALGQLNNMIADQYYNHRSENSAIAFSKCERLHGEQVMNISQKRIENGYIETQMDIFVQRKEVFTVKVKWHGDNNPAMGMMLVNYIRRRTGTGTQVTTCLPTYIDKDLCVCHVTSQAQSSNKYATDWNHYRNVFGRKSKSENRHGHCLYILTRDYSESTVFEAGNICENVQYNVWINVESDNMRTPNVVPVNTTIVPKSIRFLTFVTPLHLKNRGAWDYEIKVSTLRTKYKH